MTQTRANKLLSALLTAISDGGYNPVAMLEYAHGAGMNRADLRDLNVLDLADPRTCSEWDRRIFVNLHGTYCPVDTYKLLSEFTPQPSKEALETALTEYINANRDALTAPAYRSDCPVLLDPPYYEALLIDPPVKHLKRWTRAKRAEAAREWARKNT